MNRSLTRALLSGALLTAGALPVLADSWVPPALNPGDHYRLVFVTSGTRDALSSNISDYDTFVNNLAHASGSLVASLSSMNWLVVGSTDTVDAYTHIGGAFTTPIYNVEGQLVATNAANFWGTQLTTPTLLVNPIQYEETGVAIVDTTLNPALAWTGSYYDGTAYPGFPLGNSQAAVGGPLGTGGCFVVCQALDATNAEHFYAISATDLVAGPATSATPEPGTFGVALIGAAILIACKRFGYFQRREHH